MRVLALFVKLAALLGRLQQEGLKINTNGQKHLIGLLVIDKYRYRRFWSEVLKKKSCIERKALQFSRSHECRAVRAKRA